MREIKTESFKVYLLDELEPDAREKALEAVAEKLGGDWWDSDDIDDVSAVMVYTLANAFGTPGHGDYGVGDFPGIPGVELVSWDLDRGAHLTVRGTLTRENAPRLPWADGVVEVSLTAGRDYTSIDVEIDDDELDLMNLLDLPQVRGDLARGVEAEMDTAVRDAIHEAMRDGRAELEHKTSAEHALWVIEANGYEFREDGAPYCF